MRRSHSVPVALVRFFSESDTRAGRKPSGWRCQGLSLLHYISDRTLVLALPGLPPACGVSGGIWKASPALIVRVG